LGKIGPEKNGSEFYNRTAQFLYITKPSKSTDGMMLTPAKAPDGRERERER
jgi:hypothetical protein